MKKVIVLVGMFALCFSLFANSWELSEDGQFLTNSNNITCRLVSGIELSSTLQDSITNALDIIWKLPGLTGTECRVMINSNDYFHITLYPDSLLYKDVDLQEFMPAGLSFRYDSGLFYDVTLKVREYLPRITGAYISPDDFLKQLYAVTIMPELYLQGDVLLERIARLESAVIALSKKGVFSKPTDVSDEVILAVVNMHNQSPDITAAEVVTELKKEGLTTTKKDVEAVFLVYLGILPQ